MVAAIKFFFWLQIMYITKNNQSTEGFRDLRFDFCFFFLKSQCLRIQRIIKAFPLKFKFFKLCKMLLDFLVEQFAVTALAIPLQS